MSEAYTPDLQPEIDRKNAALADRLALIEKQAADELARFPSVNEPKDPEPKGKGKSK